MNVFKICENSLSCTYIICAFFGKYVILKNRLLKKILCKPNKHNCKSGRVRGPTVCAIYPGSNF